MCVWVSGLPICENLQPQPLHVRVSRFTDNTIMYRYNHIYIIIYNFIYIYIYIIYQIDMCIKIVSHRARYRNYFNLKFYIRTYEWVEFAADS